MRTRIAIAWIAIQGTLLFAWSVYEAGRMTPGEGTSILVRTVPVDPRDLLRGQYLQLRYEFSSPTQAPSTNGNNRDVWVVLQPEHIDGTTYYAPLAYSLKQPRTLPEGAVVLRGRRRGENDARFGIERYFVPEGTETPDPADITVRLRVGSDHRARIETVYVRDQPWPQNK